jgi:exosortase family protein XrtG
MVLLWGGLVSFFRYYRIWLFYYTVASVGLAFLIVFSGAKLIPLQRWLEIAAAYNTHYLTVLLGIPTRIFDAAPGNILVAVVAQEPGWTSIKVGVECSALLEMAVLVGLLAFYPGWSARKRTWLMGVGLVATYVANIVRLMTIVLTLHLLGKPAIFFAHTIFGRMVFFFLMVAIFWYVLTQPTIRTLGKKLGVPQ